ncbi:hypothetical protein ABPG72_016600, partial [Tetrahymena utriculariae]
IHQIMIYQSSSAIQNQQQQTRLIQLLNGQQNQKQSSSQYQKHFIYHSQSGQNVGSNLVQQQGVQFQEIAQQQQFAQQAHKIQYQHGSNASLFGNQNQIVTRSVNGPISSLQQQMTNSLHNIAKENNHQVPVIQNMGNLNQQQFNSLHIQYKKGKPTAQMDLKNKMYIHNQNQSNQSTTTQLQPINRQEQVQSSKQASIVVRINQSFSSQNLSNTDKDQNIQFEVIRREQSSSFYDKIDPQQQQIQSHTLQQDNLIQSQNSLQNKIQQQIIENNQINSHSFTHQTIVKHAPQILTQQDHIYSVKSINQLTPLSNNERFIDFQQYQTQEKQYQGFIPISTSSPQVQNNHLKFSQQLVGSQNQLSYSTYSQQNYSQQDVNKYLKLDNSIQQIGIREISPYEKCIQARRSSKDEDSFNQNKSFQSCKYKTSQIESIKEENIIVTPRKQAFVYSNEASVVSDIKSTNDMDFREKVFSYQKSQNIVIYSPNLFQQSSQTQLSPKQKLLVKEKVYGNEDVCNYYPVTHIKQEDLQKYELILQCTLQTQNQSIINQKIKDFSEGFQFSAC